MVKPLKHRSSGPRVLTPRLQSKVVRESCNVKIKV
jgi:hypothetical protein